MLSGMDFDLFAPILAAVLGANLLTVLSVWSFLEISKAEREGKKPPPYSKAGAFFAIVLFAGIFLVYIVPPG